MPGAKANNKILKQTQRTIAVNLTGHKTNSCGYSGFTFIVEMKGN